MWYANRVAAAKARVRSNRIVKAAYAHLHCVTKGYNAESAGSAALAPECRMLPDPTSLFLNRFHDILMPYKVLCILGANDEWQRLEALWWITYVSTSRLRYVSSFHHRFLGYNTGQCLMVDEWYSHRYASRSSSNIPFPVC